MIGGKIKEESKQNKIDKGSYNSYIDLETAMESTSDTLQELLEYISPKFQNSLYGCTYRKYYYKHCTGLFHSFNVVTWKFGAKFQNVAEPFL